MKDNVGQAVGVAKESPGARPFSSQIITAAHDTFVSGLHQVGLVAAGITLLAAVGVWLFLPARARDHEPMPSVADEPEPVGGGRLMAISEEDIRVRAGRPRDPACDAAILQAALDIFAEQGYAGVSIDGVAARAGVGKATIYRRYSSKAELVVEAVRCGAQIDDWLPDTGDLRADLTSMMQPLIDRLRGDDASCSQRSRWNACATLSSTRSSTGR